jgi:DNA polymerase-1
MTTWHLIDGSGYIFRAYHGLPKMNRADGTPVNAVFGFCSMLMRLRQELKTDHLIVVFDAARKTFRNDIYPEYKVHRPPAPDDLIPQFALIREAVQAFNVPCVEQEGFEADDIIATYAAQAVAQGDTAVIVSADKDLMQLIRAGITLFDPMKNKPIGTDQVFEKFGVAPDRVVDVQALAGDSSDNVPGIAGIGIKTASALIQEYGDLDTLLARAGEIKQQKRRESLLNGGEIARISRELVRLKHDVPLVTPLSAVPPVDFQADLLIPFLRMQGFHALLKRVEAGQQNITPRGVMLGESREAAGERGKGNPDNNSLPPFFPSPPAPLLPPSYTLITTPQALTACLAEMTDAGVFAIDTETTSLNALQAELVGISLCAKEGVAYYIPVGHRGGSGEATGESTSEDPTDNTLPLFSPSPPASQRPPTLPPPPQLPKALVLERLKPLLTNPALLKVGHNLKYDMLVLGNQAIPDVTPFADTMLLSYVINGSQHGHGMDELAERYLGHTTIKYKDVTGTGKKQISFAEVPLEQAKDYAAEDADITLQLYQLFAQQLPLAKMATVYETLERPLLPVLVDMERRGIKVDPLILKNLSNDFAATMATLEQAIIEAVGHPFNLASPKQLGEVLFDELGLPAPKKTKTGQYPTGVEVLEPLALQGYPVPQQVLQWRQLAKLKSTYTDALLTQINPLTKRVHTSFSQTVTNTGRLSSNNPNLQNIPIRTVEGRKLRTAFVADAGNVLLSLDYSQIELRLLAEMADIKPLQQAFIEGQDIHKKTASEIFNVSLAEVTPEHRRRAKTINFGIIYGISAFGLSQQLGCSQSEAKQLIERYFAEYAGIKTFMDDTIAFAKQHGYVETLFGRRCFVSGINEKNPALRNFAERAAVNAPLQGTAADIIKRAMIRIGGRREAVGKSTENSLVSLLPPALLLQVHDELIFEVPSEQADAQAAVLKSIMENAAAPAVSLKVPLVVDVGKGLTWGEAH